MSTFKDRVVIERDQLVQRCALLSKFIHTTDTFPTLPIVEQARLRYQLMLMNELHSVLCQRINNDFQ